MSAQKTQEDKLTQLLYSEDAENEVLGTMLSSPDEFVEEARNFPLEPEDFYVPANKLIFRVMLEMSEAGESIGVSLLHQKLQMMGEAEHVGSPGLLATYLAGATIPELRYFRSHAMAVRQKAVMRKLRETCKAIERDMVKNPGDVVGILATAEEQILDVAHTTIVANEGDFGMEIQEAALAIFEHADSGGGLRGLPTGFAKMDELTHGWGAGELIIVAARPGKGKTGLALSLVRTLVSNGFNAETGHYDVEPYGAKIFSMEMKRADLYMRFYSMEAGVGLTSIMEGQISESARARIEGARERMANWKIFIDDTTRMDISLIRSRARRAVRRHNVSAIVVDYLQLAKSRKYPKDRQNEVADISATLKQIAMENSVPVIALAQLNRDAEKDDEPLISHIRDSGAIEQDADKIILLHDTKERIKGHDHTMPVRRYQAILAKHRNGRQGRVDLDFQTWRVLFQEAT